MWGKCAGGNLWVFVDFKQVDEAVVQFKAVLPGTISKSSPVVCDAKPGEV